MGEVSPTSEPASFVPMPAFSPLQLSALSLITAIAAMLRFHLLGAKIFWFDECVGVEIARLDWFNFARILWRREANMSLYYLFLRLWLYLGSTPAFVRSLSVIFALATIPALYRLGRRLFDSRTGFIAAILLTFNAYHIRYSQEARSYALTVLLCVMSSLFFIESLQNSSRRARVGHILISSLAVYAHFFAALVILAQYVSLRFLDRAKIPASTSKNWRWIGLAILPVAMFVIATGAGPLSWIPRPSLHGLWVFAIFLTGNEGAMLVTASVIACGAAVLPVVLSKPTRRSSWESWRYWFLMLWLVFPVLLTVALSFARPLFLARYFVICLPALNLLMAAGLARLRSLWLVTPALIALLILSWQGTISYYQRDFDLGRDNWADASQFLLSNALPADAIVFDIAMGRMPYEYNRSILSPGSSGPTVLYPNHGPRITFMDFVGKPDYAQLKNSIYQYPRVWLVLSYVESPSGLEPNARSMVALLSDAYPEYKEYHFTGVDVCLFAKPDSQP
jgi:4-amino-4-deoxy-L-arabinose transferase-like glycosyltransferase